MKMASNQLEKKDYLKTSLRAYFLQNGFNYGNYQGLGYANVLYPSLRKMYKDDDDKLQEALKENIEFFNTNIHFLPFITSLHLVMLENRTPSSEIRNIKMALMGPLAGIGDSFFWGTLRIIAAGIGLSLAQQGSVLGAILFLIIFNVPHLLIRYYGTVLGYQFGAGLMSNSKSAGILKMISKGASIVGLMVIGAMSASMVAMKTPLTFTIGETAFELQGYLDQIFPLLLPLLYTLAMFGLLKKGCKSTTILLITIAVGVIGSLLHIL